MPDSAPSLADPDFEPTDEQLNKLLASAGRVARWRAAMADAGIRVLANTVPIDEQERLANAWAGPNEHSR